MSDLQKRRRRGAPMVAALLLLLGCGRDGGSPVDLAAEARTRIQRKATVFTRKHLVIAGLGTSVAPPVAVNSDTQGDMVSDDPGIVAIAPGGSLIGRSAGRTVVRSRDGAQKLSVTVLDATALEVIPPELDMSEQETVRLTLRAGSQEIPVEEARWLVGNHLVAHVRDGVIRSERPGTTKVVVELGSLRTEAEIRVRARKVQAGPLVQRRTTVHRGSVFRMPTEHAGGARAHEGEWKIEDARVIEHVARDVFRAKTLGRTRVCAPKLSQNPCTLVEVLR